LADPAQPTAGQKPALAQKYDARGLRCPLPVIRAEAILRTMKAGQTLQIIADDPIAVIDIPHFCQTAGHVVTRDRDLEAQLLGRNADIAESVCVFRVTAAGKSTE